MKKFEKWKYRLRYLKTHNKNYKENERLLHSTLGRIFFLIKLFLTNIIEFDRNNINEKCTIYFFGKKLANIPFFSIEDIKVSLNYFFILLKLRFLIRQRKIRVGFHVNIVEKWTCQSLYDAFKNSKHFEPIIMISKIKWKVLGEKELYYFHSNCEFFDKLGMKYIKLYDEKTDTDLPIDRSFADIIFYQQPWYIPDIQTPHIMCKNALLCYTPYCVYSMNSSYNYISWFHKKLWKFFVETEFHTKQNKKNFNANNCKALGFVKLDNYQTIKNIDTDKYWKTKDKKRIIYAPHHSVERDKGHAASTFIENGQFILDFAKSHSEVEWKFRPHPALVETVVCSGLMKECDIEKYYQEWENIGSISKPGTNYYEEFLSSDCLITDCISFLTEYLPSGHPVLHLRSEGQLTPFNTFTNKIIESYYQIHSNSDFISTFDEVITNGNDYLKEKRENCIKDLNIYKDKTTGQRIVEYIEQQLWIRR